MDATFLKNKSSSLTRALFYICLTGLGVAHADPDFRMFNPAVSAVNGWLGIAGGTWRDDLASGPAALAEGGVAGPLTYPFGYQLRAETGAIAHSNLKSLDGQMFWRAPEIALLGLHGTYVQTSGVYQNMLGLHGEGYLTRWTFVAEVGGAQQNIQRGTSYGEAILHWYVNPDFRLHLGGIMMFSDTLGELGTEYQFDIPCYPGIAFFADGGIGNHDTRYALIGLRYYFGENKPLVRRQREDNVLPTLNGRLIQSTSA